MSNTVTVKSLKKNLLQFIICVVLQLIVCCNYQDLIDAVMKDAACTDTLKLLCHYNLNLKIVHLKILLCCDHVSYDRFEA